MTPLAAKIAFCAMPVAWYVIRLPHELRSRRTPVTRNARDLREVVLLLISLSGLGIIPFLYVATGMPRMAERAFVPVLAWLGIAVALVALLMFRLTHKALGRNWSVSLEVRENHRLIQEGVYARVRHPMYTAFWLWAVAQALLLPNWVAGLSGLVGFGTLYLFRIGREERMMLEAFGDEYRIYAARTARLIPWLY
ncbi:protein-S-isoprenylcysteine O-methyltransferase [Enterovirga rhinocerotis]|uniref:Protein-S-isoprenylcysteine O-methyltransferase Ste14 n=1 Tax=Enterovirga rhinocerotis TaxID=1339210 RepID=A0A4R7C0X8_9HYPH|nr:protein-S-isoprenylcysteine O-methyltransferase [Enterovirga rhinocerotis]TDR90147.1 protein-S-isoprenylcysteine O-methyltransferase Ste14 [Enterovirga rhinocerotis]